MLLVRREASSTIYPCTSRVFQSMNNVISWLRSAPRLSFGNWWEIISIHWLIVKLYGVVYLNKITYFSNGPSCFLSALTCLNYYNNFKGDCFAFFFFVFLWNLKILVGISLRYYKQKAQQQWSHVTVLDFVNLLHYCISQDWACRLGSKNKIKIS